MNEDLQLLLEKFDTDKSSPLRDANPELWCVLYGAEMIDCIPFEEFKEHASLQYWVWAYARQVARSAVKLFNPDGTPK